LALSDWVSFLAYPHLFGIKGFVVVGTCQVTSKKKGEKKEKKELFSPSIANSLGI
jgi:hypothetical protein